LKNVYDDIQTRTGLSHAVLLTGSVILTLALGIFCGQLLSMAVPGPSPASRRVPSGGKGGKEKAASVVAVGEKDEKHD
jgi:hypothetical protein